MALATQETVSLEDREEELRRTNHKLYLAICHHRSTRGKPLEFGKMKFLVPIYKALDNKRELCVQKSVQCGVSEALVVSHLEEAAKGLAILYVLPKTDNRNSFVQTRINRMIKSVPLYEKLLQSASVAKADSVMLKHYGRGIIKYVASNSWADFKEFPADALYLDEKDQMDQVVISMAPDRLQSSEHRLYRAVANPTVEEFGIDVDWRESTQGEWNIRCESCRTWQTLDWFENVVETVGTNDFRSRDKEWVKDPTNEHGVFCVRCGKPLDRFAAGKYVHAHPNRKKVGFRINQIFGARHIPMSEIVEAFFRATKNQTDLQLFYNSRLGIPFTAKGSKITRGDIFSCTTAEYQAPDNFEGTGAVLGADVGKVIHVAIRRVVTTKGNPNYPLLYLGKVRDENGLLRLARRFNVKFGVIDALPETRTVQRAQAIMSSLYAAYYNDSARYPRLDKQNKAITIDRTVSLDRVREAIDAKQYINPEAIKNAKEYLDHMSSSVRVLDDKGRFVWRETGADHYLHSEAYCLMAADMLASRNIFQFYEEESEEREEQRGKTRDEVLGEIGEREGGPTRQGITGINAGDTW